jgi:hypothetical protein
MKTAVGTFRDRDSAERAVAALRDMGFTGDRVTLLTPGHHATSESMPTTEGEAPGMGQAIGAAMGAAIGGAAGMTGVALATFMVPGIGPVIAAGILGAALFGAGGAALGGALETELTEGVPRDEALIYADALRRGRSVVVALADDEAGAEAARAALLAAGAEGLDVARDQWWEDVRETQRERYLATGRTFDTDERLYRRGFEAALRLGEGATGYGDVQQQLRELAPDAYDREEFRIGFEDGLAWRQAPGDVHDRDREGREAA